MCVLECRFSALLSSVTVTSVINIGSKYAVSARKQCIKEPLHICIIISCLKQYIRRISLFVVYNNNILITYLNTKD